MTKIDKNVQLAQSSFTPRQVAEAIGLSESSLKRWCDRGLLPSHRTAGGHRRLPLTGVLRFVRENKYELRDPSMLGLPNDLTAAPALAELAALFKERLIAGDANTVRRLGLEAFLSGPSLAPIFDRVIAPALHAVGHDWESGTLEVFRERRSVGIVLQLLHEFRRLIESPAEDALVAIGATLAGDHYQVAVTMAELILAELGWRSSTLGSNLPTATLLEAFDTLKPRLVCLNVSYIADSATFVADYRALYDAAVHQGIAVAVGGHGLSQAVRSEIRATAFCTSMAELLELGRALIPRSAADH